MIISNVSLLDLHRALAEVNDLYNNNIRYNREPEPLSSNNRRFRLTLRCKDSIRAGHRISYYDCRPLVSACYHVHGHFFKSLPDFAIIRTLGRQYQWLTGEIISEKSENENCHCPEILRRGM